MKTIVAVVCLILAIVSSTETFGQFNRGRWLAGGSVSLNTSSTEWNFNGTPLRARTTTFTLGPQVGYFVIDNLVVGASLTAMLSGSNGESVDGTTGTIVDTKGKSNYLRLGPFVRYYLPRSIFLQVSGEYGYGTHSSEFGSSTTEGDSKNFDYGAAVGYAYFLNDYVALEPTLGYRSTGSSINDSETRRGSLYLMAAFTIYLGERK